MLKNGTERILMVTFGKPIINDHDDRVPVLTGTAKQQIAQMGSKSLAGIYKFLYNKKRTR